MSLTDDGHARHLQALSKYSQMSNNVISYFIIFEVRAKLTSIHISWYTPSSLFEFERHGRNWVFEFVRSKIHRKKSCLSSEKKRYFS